MNRTPDRAPSNPISRAFARLTGRDEAHVPHHDITSDTPQACVADPPSAGDPVHVRQNNGATAGLAVGAIATNPTIRTPAHPNPDSARRADAAAHADAPALQVIPRTYTVADGDSLRSIAQGLYGRADAARLLFDANRDRLIDPYQLRSGQVLVVPVASPLH